MDVRRAVIDKAKGLAKAGRHFRFFSVNGEIWECYQAEYMPDIGERAWLASPIRVYTYELDSRLEVIQKYEDQLSEAVADLREPREDYKALRTQWLQAKSILKEFIAWHETGARLDSLQLDRIRDEAADLIQH